MMMLLEGERKCFSFSLITKPMKTKKKYTSPWESPYTSSHITHNSRWKSNLFFLIKHLILHGHKFDAICTKSFTITITLAAHKFRFEISFLSLSLACLLRLRPSRRTGWRRFILRKWHGLKALFAASHNFH